MSDDRDPAGFLVPPPLLAGMTGAVTAAPAGERLLASEHAVTVRVPQVLLDDCALPGMADLLRRAANGERVFGEAPEPRRHRCPLCWLASFFPGHERCRHGYLIPGCDCYDC